MREYPRYVFAALGDVGLFSPEEADLYLDAFTTQWGGYDEHSLRRALREGHEFDRLFVIWALGAMGLAEARVELLPMLESPHLLERWASALVLGELREERALPVLWQMLLEMLSPDADQHTIKVLDAEWQAPDYYYLWRYGIPTLLGEWGRAESVPPLRMGLHAALQAELALEPGHEDDLGSPDYWREYQDRVVYALGRLGGFGALAGIPGSDTLRRRGPDLTGIGPPQSHLDHWRIHLIMGTLHGKYIIEHAMTWRWTNTPELLKEVTQLLAHAFGIGPDEAAPALQRYAVEMGFTLAAMYGWRRKDAEGHNQS